jgi:predicted TIM-barrel fold metal-dependent hydrolase
LGTQELLKKHTANLGEEEKNWILHDNVAELYNLAL